jgi:hypothetical protein
LLIITDIVMLQEKMTVDSLDGLLLVLVMVEAKRTLPRNILSLGGQVV